MADGFGSRFERREGESRTLGSALRSAGRLALWAAVCLLLVRGAAGILSSPSEPRPAGRRGEVAADPASAAFAVRFARTYLEDPSRDALAPLLAAGAHIGTGRPPSAGGAEVAQAEVLRSSALGGGRAVLTVACELRDSRTLNLAVPIVRSRAGEVAALGAPSLASIHR